MKKWEKEILQKQIQDEAQVTLRIEKVYKQALDEINDKILVLQTKNQTQSVIYQLKYQQELQKQVESVYSKMAGTWYQTIDEYLKDCYEDSFYSTMYALHQEGIPVIIPFDQKEVTQAAAQDFGVYGQKLSQKLYANTYETATKVIPRISKGIAMNSSYATIALEIAKTGTASVNQALRIVRTESHRIHEEVKFQTINKVKEEKGADIVKQWDSTIDRKTRKSHAALDGQLREIDQPFKSPTSGHTAMYPGGFGIASEDINCRCVILQRARWALDNSELNKAVGDLDGMTEDQLDELATKMGVSKDELIKASNGIIESDGSINHTIKAKNYNQFKKKYQTKAKAQAAQQAAQNNVQQITDLQNAVTDAQNKLNAIPNKTYSGIWKNDVSLSDYEFKKDSIQKKKDWYLQQIASGNLTKAQENQFLQYINDLDEFEIEGAKYLQAKNDLLDLQKQLKAASGTSSASIFGNDAYGQRKANAYDWNYRADADKYYRPKLDAEWKNYTEHEKYATWEYTHNSNPINRSLSGYEDTFERWGFKGVGNVDWGYEDNYNNRRLSSSEFIKKFGKNGTAQPDYHRTITDLTNAIEKTEIDDDVFLVRGSENGGFAGLLESIMPFDDAQNYLDNADIKSLKALAEGNTVRNHAFTSTGIAKDGGFSKNISYKIYAPKGTKGIYAEPQSYYGNTISGEEIYKVGKSYYSVSSEAEVILQRGTDFKITKIEYTGVDSYGRNKFDVEMEVVNQPDYFKYGDEDTFNNGLTRHSK